MNLKERIGHNIAIHRKQAGLKQSELAEMVNISTKHQSRVETGVHFPSAELFEKYSKALNIDVSKLLNINDINTSENLIREINKMLATANNEQIKLIFNIIKVIIMDK